MDTEATVELTAVTHRFLTPDGREQPAVLKDVSLRVLPGETVSLMGPSGSGKSTLLNLIAGFEPPTAGRICVGGQDLAGQSDAERSLWRNRTLGFVFQAHHLLPQCTALENVLLPTLAPGQTQSPAEARARAERLLQRVGLSDRMGYRQGWLSGGERQRVAVVRALINRPSLILADEPTGALDSQAAGELTDLLLQLNREEQVSLIVATHAPALAGRMQRLFILRNGLLQAGATGG